jgi:subfamily B ATP-binding cassette protein MsbA
MGVDVGWIRNWFDSITQTLILGDTLMDSMRNLSVYIFCIFTARGIVKYIGRIINVRLEEGLMKSIRDTMFLKVTDLSMDFFSRKKAGDIISLLTNDVGAVNHSAINSVTSIWREGINVVLNVVVLLAISTKLTAIAVCISALSFLVIRFTTRTLRRYGARLQRAQADYTGTLQETVGGIRVVKALGVEQTMVQRFVSQTANYVRMSLRNERISALVPVVNDTFGILALSGVLFAGGVALANHEIAPSILLTFLGLLFSLMQPITSIVSTITGMQRGVAAANNVVDLLDEQSSIVGGSGNVGTFSQALVVNNVTFSYGNADVLRSVSFTLHKGETIALVGASGSGKSTMLDLLLRFYDPQQGSISIDGKDVRSLDLAEYRKLFGMVSQETILFNDTVANNITLGLRDVTTDRIERAAQVAHAHNFISQLPEGYNTGIGDRGMRLSGGQRQRLAIARAVVREPDILLFDEATSALDTESERIVQEAISDVLSGRTAVVVAHRLSTIVNADRILVFEDGRIVEEGKHAELLDAGGVYARLHALQFSGGSVS